MVEHVLFALTFMSALGAGLMAGFFFAFSLCVMTALGRQLPAAGISAMQAINVVVLNPLFFAVFFGTAAACLVAAIGALVSWPAPAAVVVLAGSLSYLVGSILVTIVFNVPLNNALAAVDPESSEGTAVWTRYLSVWTAWNHVRTVACLVAAAAFVLALLVL
jgi:uncharacterized membrane protein